MKKSLEEYNEEIEEKQVTFFCKEEDYDVAIHVIADAIKEGYEAGDSDNDGSILKWSVDDDD